MRWPKDGRLTAHLWGGSHEEYINLVDFCQIPHRNSFLLIKSHRDGLASTTKVKLRDLDFNQKDHRPGQVTVILWLRNLQLYIFLHTFS
jgi:hypothetical protein